MPPRWGPNRAGLLDKLDRNLYKLTQGAAIPQPSIEGVHDMLYDFAIYLLRIEVVVLAVGGVGLVAWIQIDDRRFQRELRK